MPAGNDAPNQTKGRQPSVKRRVTLKEVAERAGVSAAAASAALTGRRGTTRVSSETAAMIHRVADEMGYAPHTAAEGLITRGAGAVALALPYAAGFWDGNPFNLAVIQGAAEAAARTGYDLILRTHRPYEWQQWDAAHLMDSRADGVLVICPAIGSPLLSALAEADYSAVAAVCDPNHCPIPSVNADDAESARAAVTYLIRLGHRRIGLLAGPEDLGTAAARREGYLAAMQAAGLDVPPSRIARARPEDNGGFRAAVELLAGQPRPTALFAFNDLVARGAIDAARQMGLAVPEQLSVVGFDDAEFAARLNPPLTTVRYPVREVVAAGIEYLTREVAQRATRRGHRAFHRAIEPQTERAIILPAQLVVRQSCLPPPAELSL